MLWSELVFQKSASISMKKSFDIVQALVGVCVV